MQLWECETNVYSFIMKFWSFIIAVNIWSQLGISCIYSWNKMKPFKKQHRSLLQPYVLHEKLRDSQQRPSCQIMQLIQACNWCPRTYLNVLFRSYWKSLVCIAVGWIRECHRDCQANGDMFDLLRWGMSFCGDIGAENMCEMPGTATVNFSW